MGWTFPNAETRKEVIEDCLRSWKSPGGRAGPVAHCTRGNVLWVVWETYTQATGHFERVILCILMRRYVSNGVPDWGYKDMEESMEPFYYSCPLKYLRMGTRVFSPEWRQTVRIYHAQTAAIREYRKRLDAERAKRIAEAIPPEWSPYRV